MELGFGVDFKGNGKAVRCQGDVFGNQAVNGVRFVHALLGQGVERQHADAVFVVAFEGKGVERVKSTEERRGKCAAFGGVGIDVFESGKVGRIFGWLAKAYAVGGKGGRWNQTEQRE